MVERKTSSLQKVIEREEPFFGIDQLIKEMDKLAAYEARISIHKDIYGVLRNHINIYKYEAIPINEAVKKGLVKNNVEYLIKIAMHDKNLFRKKWVEYIYVYNGTSETIWLEVIKQERFMINLLEMESADINKTYARIGFVYERVKKEDLENYSELLEDIRKADIVKMKNDRLMLYKKIPGCCKKIIGEYENIVSLEELITAIAYSDLLERFKYIYMSAEERKITLIR